MTNLSFFKASFVEFWALLQTKVQGRLPEMVYFIRSHMEYFYSKEQLFCRKAFEVLFLYHFSPSTSDPNPFGDPDSGDEHASQGSGSGSARKSPEPGAVLSIPARVIYAYVADEDDEISAEAGKHC